MDYKFKYRHKNDWFWTTVKVIGHKLEGNNTMVLFLENGLIAIPEWSNNYFLKLGSDWMLFEKKSMEEQSGVKVT